MSPNFWTEKNVLITGVAGLIGSNLAAYLLGNKARVTGIVRSVDRVSDDEQYGDLTIFTGDVTDYRFLREIISSREITHIFHLAAYSIVRISARDPLNAFNVNVMGTVSLLEAARNVGSCESIVVASSDKAYGDHDVLPYVETHALLPRNTYDASKACADIVARTYANNYDMPVAVTRCSNVYGPRDRNLSRIVPNTIRRLYDGKRPTLYSDVENMEREFIYVDDVVGAFLTIGERIDVCIGQALNIGGTGPVKIRDLVSTICDVAGKSDVEPEIIERSPMFREITRQCIDSSKLESLTGWTPSTTLRSGLIETVDWYHNFYEEMS